MIRRLSRSFVTGAAAMVVVAGACGGAASASSTAKAPLHSGTVGLRLTAAAGAAGGHEVGFSLDGPFELRKGQLPIARLQLTQLLGSRQLVSAFTSTGSRVFVHVNGRDYELPPERTAAFRADPKATPTLGLDVDRWVVGGRSSDGPRIDGVTTTRTRGSLDVVRALNDVFGLAQQLGSDSGAVPAPLTGSAADQVRKAVRSSSIEVVAGRKDHVLRSLHFDVTFAIADQPKLAAALGRLASTSLALDLRVTGANRPVTVTAPADARPLSELPTTTSTTAGR